MATVDVSKVARALNLEVRRIQQLVQEGMPREARGQYDPIKCAAWYIRYLQRAIERKAMPMFEEGSAGERAARLRILRTQADLKEIKVAEQRSQLVATRDADASLADLVSTTERRIMAIPAQLAPELVGETSRTLIQAKIQKACNEALRDLAKAGNYGGKPNTRGEELF